MNRPTPTFRTSVDLATFAALEGQPLFRTYALLQGLAGHPSCPTCGRRLSPHGFSQWDALVISLWSCLALSCDAFEQTVRVETTLETAPTPAPFAAARPANNPRCTVGICQLVAVQNTPWCPKHYGMNNGD